MDAQIIKNYDKPLKLLVFIIMVVSCYSPGINQEELTLNTEDKKNIEQPKAISGTYILEVVDSPSIHDAELYTHYTSGSANWKWVGNDSLGGIETLLQENGIWSVTDTGIVINIDVDSIVVREIFIFKNGLLINPINPQVHLKKIE